MHFSVIRIYSNQHVCSQWTARGRPTEHSDIPIKCSTLESYIPEDPQNRRFTRTIAGTIQLSDVLHKKHHYLSLFEQATPEQRQHSAHL